MKDSPCILCGQCVSVCPTGALMEKSEIGLIDEAFKAGKHVVVQTAPAVRAALGEEFDLPVGTPVTGKMVAALRRLGFFRVYDTNFGADLTIMEEGTELLHRLQNGGTLPMITSCSPGWINYAEYNYSDLLPHLSSCKSPHQMQGAIIKSYWAEQKGIDPKDVFVVSIMPCTAKKFEKERDVMEVDGIRDVDAVGEAVGVGGEAGHLGPEIGGVVRADADDGKRLGSKQGARRKDSFEVHIDSLD
jgi:NADP-reducing hydrogenase subunit HndD